MSKQYNYTKPALAAAKEFLNPLSGDFLQACQCKHLATIITKHCYTTEPHPNATEPTVQSPVTGTIPDLGYKG